jgi:hypothetical protein
MEFNFLGIAFVADDIPKKKAEKVYALMEDIIEKYKEKAQEEFDAHLEKMNLESAMGVVIPKEVRHVRSSRKRNNGSAEEYSSKHT